MPRIATIQMSMSTSSEANITKATGLVTQAASSGAQIILLPELFETPYFCKDKDDQYFSLAHTQEENPLIQHFKVLASALEVVLPISYFEVDDGKYYNSIVVIDSDGTVLDNYRKIHIPDGPGYEEKYYFQSGDLGYKTFDTHYGKIGVAICWDQWFSEVARSLTLLGAEVILYPTAIGSEPEIKIDSKDHWQRVQLGHAACNMVPVVAANRYGHEKGVSCDLDFYGSSFMSDHTGKILCEAPRDEESILYAEYDFQVISKQRDYWALLSDRKPQSYTEIVK